MATLVKLMADLSRQNRYIKEITNDYNRFVANQLEVCKSIDNLVEAQQKVISPVLQDLFSLSHNIGSLFMDSFVDRINEEPWLEWKTLGCKLRDDLLNLVSPLLQELWRSYEELPPRVQEALIALGDKGWFYDMNMPFSRIGTFKKAIDNDELEVLEQHLINYYEENLLKIEHFLVTTFPHRARFISLAFKAHQRGEYELSIPTLFAQVDGICSDLVGQCYFMSKKKRPNTVIYTERFVEDTLRAAFVSPLAHVFPIGLPKNDRPVDFDQLNRHMVMHGESLDYGTKVNSLMVISLFNYIAQVLTLDHGRVDNDSL